MRKNVTAGIRDEVGTTSPQIPARTAEFDAFGPWVDEVWNHDGVPRLYRDFPIDFTTTLAVLKVPRDIERRLANPAMHLYDHLIIVDAETLTVLSRRQDDTYGVENVKLTDVAAVTMAVNLLDGRLIIMPATGRSIETRFSGAAKETIASLVTLLRSQGWHRPGVPARSIPQGSPLADVQLRGVDEILGNDCRADLGASGNYRALAAFERRPVKSTRTGLGKLIDLLRPVALQGAVIASDGVELRIFGRISPLRRRSLAEYSDRRVSISLAAISEVRSEAHPAVEGVSDVTISLGRAAGAGSDAGTVQVSVPTGSDAEQALLALAPQA